MEYRVKLVEGNETNEYKVEEGTNLLKFLRKNSEEISSPCGGKGTCGKCRVKVEGLTQKPFEKEAKLLGVKSLEAGYRLACYNKVNSDITVFVGKPNSKMRIVTEGKENKTKLQPIVRKAFVSLEKPSIHDQTPDLQRVQDALKKHKVKADLELLKKLPECIRQKDFEITLVTLKDRLIAVEAGDTSKTLYGIAADIGTTTIAAYLYDLVTGKRLGVYSEMNPQKKFGADVISRIEYTMASPEAVHEMQKTIVDCMNGIVGHFTAQFDLRAQDIYFMTFVGNTTMMHMLLGLSAKNIAVSPFIPVTTEMHLFKAEETGIQINSSGYMAVLPSVSGYIGADTVAAVISSGMAKRKEISLLIDIGTNGEIVLGNKEWMVACSTAAGPAFEGANIRNGIGGIAGAIDKVIFKPEFKFTTIGNEAVAGICGSGIVDMIAGMLETGIIDETGRILDQDESEADSVLLERVIEIDGKNAFWLANYQNSDGSGEIAVTQKDVRELQNAKAAIAAGIRVLAKQAGIGLEQIDKVYLAGGFGNYINIESALKISLIPKELKGKIESIGNAAGAGAAQGLLSKHTLRDALKIKDKVKYLELSARSDFMDEYIEAMMFE